MDVALVLIEDERQLLFGLEGPPLEVAVHLVFEEALHFVLAVLLLHDHECRVLAHGL